MKPITHPLAIAYVEAFIRGTADELSSAGRSWRDAGYPLYAGPAPMPPPALGMRAYRMSVDADGCQHARPPVDVTYCRSGVGWADYCDDPESITLITDFRTGEVLWRRS